MAVLISLVSNIKLWRFTFKKMQHPPPPPPSLNHILGCKICKSYSNSASHSRPNSNPQISGLISLYLLTLEAPPVQRLKHLPQNHPLTLVINIKLLNQPVKNIKNREKKDEDQEVEIKLSPCLEPFLLSTVLLAQHLLWVQAKEC